MVFLADKSKDYKKSNLFMKYRSIDLYFSSLQFDYRSIVIRRYKKTDYSIMNKDAKGHFAGRGIDEEATIDRNFRVWRCIKLGFTVSIHWLHLLM